MDEDHCKFFPNYAIHLCTSNRLMRPHKSARDCLHYPLSTLQTRQYVFYREQMTMTKMMMTVAQQNLHLQFLYVRLGKRPGPMPKVRRRKVFSRDQKVTSRILPRGTLKNMGSQNNICIAYMFSRKLLNFVFFSIKISQWANDKGYK